MTSTSNGPCNSRLSCTETHEHYILRLTESNGSGCLWMAGSHQCVEALGVTDLSSSRISSVPRRGCFLPAVSLQHKDDNRTDTLTHKEDNRTDTLTHEEDNRMVTLTHEEENRMVTLTHGLGPGPSFRWTEPVLKVFPGPGLVARPVSSL